ncbi:PadR family transcriptional regulator [Pseudarthrobacter sp. BRE9]|jgi:DNA-binding PadR family transcriptional regulator|uniref:PadR family transcriptional regulator n=1 Tax=Pseudarthrobacter sp. BRE9 TaxID=2962582 RepID=UPI0028815666|nr:PadR family transcriptional regulator [Pseudarthrobacter sp. BRE9]MDT0167588.1 PadR family transcriptional regulator [Pseudarthrobacter sp. BRE9]
MPPVFAHGALRLYLLALLESGPKHGYELIKALKDRFGGTYSPSAGTIYPRLGKLEDNGLVTTERAGRRTNYRITAAGLAELDRRREDLAGVEKDIAASVQRLDVEVMLQKFRDDLCADLRGQALRRPISPVTLETVRTTLDDARAAIRSTLQS